MLPKLRLGASFYTQSPDGTCKPTVNYIAGVMFKPYKMYAGITNGLYLQMED